MLIYLPREKVQGQIPGTDERSNTHRPPADMVRSALWYFLFKALFLLRQQHICKEPEVVNSSVYIHIGGERQWLAGVPRLRQRELLTVLLNLISNPAEKCCSLLNRYLGPRGESLRSCGNGQSRVLLSRGGHLVYHCCCVWVDIVQVPASGRLSEHATDEVLQLGGLAHTVASAVHCTNQPKELV
jgi:hypothetical protein